MECKKCSQDLSGKEYREVAQWNFCLECFQKLMEKGETQSTEPTPPNEKCQVCQTELEPGQGHSLMGMLCCSRCKEVLTFKTGPGKYVAPAEEPQAPQAVPQVQVDLRKTIRCSGCNRQIPVLGGKISNGQAYCPDCFSALPCADQPESDPAQGGGLCQACQRQTEPEGAQIVSGFSICKACFTTDRGAAVEIARARHRKDMERMKRELNL